MVAEHGLDRQACKGKVRSHAPEFSAAGQQFGQSAGGEPCGLSEVIHPVLLLQVHQQRSAGIAHVTAVALAAGELPEQPAFHRAETEVIAGRGSLGVVVVVEHPADLAGTEVGVEQQARAPAPLLLQSLLLPGVADGGGAAVLPDEGRSAGEATAAAPQHGGFPLVGDAAAHHRFALPLTELRIELHQGLPLAGPDLDRVLFHPSIGGVGNRQRCTGAEHQIP